MKLGDAKLIFLALFIFSVPNVSIGNWHQDAWPSTNSFRITDYGDFFLATNLLAKRHVENWSQESTTNFIPEITDTLDGYLFTVGSHDASSRTWTNVYYTEIVADAEGLSITNNWPSSYSKTNVFEWVTTNGTNVDTNTVITIVSGETDVYKVDWRFDIPQIWGWDAYSAVRERVIAYQNSLLDDFFLTTSIPRPKFYRDARQTLVSLKSTIEAMLGEWIDIADEQNEFESHFDSFEWIWRGTNRGWVQERYVSDFPMLDVKSLASQVDGFPHEIQTQVVTNSIEGWRVGVLESNTIVTTHTITNAVNTWFDYTPYQIHELGGWYAGYTNKQDFSWTFDVDLRPPLTFDFDTFSFIRKWQIEDGFFFSQNVVRTNIVTDPWGLVYEVEIVANLFDETNLFQNAESLVYTITQSNTLIQTSVFTNNTTEEIKHTTTHGTNFIAEGFTSSDYGYSVLPHVLSKMVAVPFSNISGTGDTIQQTGLSRIGGVNRSNLADVVESIVVFETNTTGTITFSGGNIDAWRTRSSDFFVGEFFNHFAAEANMNWASSVAIQKNTFIPAEAIIYAGNTLRPGSHILLGGRTQPTIRPSDIPVNFNFSARGTGLPPFIQEVLRENVGASTSRVDVAHGLGLPTLYPIPSSPTQSERFRDENGISFWQSTGTVSRIGFDIKWLGIWDFSDGFNYGPVEF